MRALKVLVVGLSLLAPTPAIAWDTKVDEDPLNDTKIAYTMTMGGRMALAIKCWDSQPDQTQMILVTGLDYDQSASYKDVVDVVIRIDKGVRHELQLQPEDFSGSLGLITTSGKEASLQGIIAEIGNAKIRVTIGLGSQMQTFDAAGSSKAIKTLADTCHLNWDAKPASN